METALQELVDRLAKAHGESLISVVLYGSGATGDHQEGFSDLNILCVLRQITPRELADSEKVFHFWRSNGNPAPLLLSERELETSTDCFAIEFHDIQSSHKILYGRDAISSLAVDNSFYRAQVERELRAKLLRLRQKASSVLSEKDALSRLLIDSVSTFCVLFRHALILSGATSDPRKRRIVEQAGQTFGIDTAPFTTLLDIREKKIKSKELDPEPLLGSYLKQIGTVIEAVDRISK